MLIGLGANLRRPGIMARSKTGFCFSVKRVLASKLGARLETELSWSLRIASPRVRGWAIVTSAEPQRPHVRICADDEHTKIPMDDRFLGGSCWRRHLGFAGSALACRRA